MECALLLAGILYEQKPDEKRILNLLIEAITYAYEEELSLPFWFEKKRLLNIYEIYQKALQEAVFLRRQPFSQQS